MKNEVYIIKHNISHQISMFYSVFSMQILYKYELCNSSRADFYIIVFIYNRTVAQSRENVQFAVILPFARCFKKMMITSFLSKISLMTYSQNQNFVS
jgi:hypothetical protein